MKDLGLSLTGPVTVIIALLGLGLLAGADPWLIGQGLVLVVPICAYVAFAVFTVVWAIKIGDIGLHQNMTFQSRFYFYHGLAVILTIVLAAAGSFIVLFATLIGGRLGGTL